MIFARKALRDLRAMGMRAVLIVLVIGAGTGTAAGVGLGLDQVRATRQAFYRNYGLADLDVRLTRPLPRSLLLARARAAGATAAQARLVLSGTALGASGAQTAAELVGMEPSATLDRLAVLDGRPLSESAPVGALLEADFARHAHVRVGQRLRVRVAGRMVVVVVRGLARSPEYLLATANPDYLMPQRGSLAVVFLPERGLQRLVAAGAGANDLVVDFPPGTAARRGAVLAAGLPVARLTPREQQFSMRFTDADLHSFSVFAPVMGAVFAAIALLLIALTLRRLVHSQRRELGGLLALGYPRRTVVFTVLAPAGALGVAGALLALAVTVLVGRLIADEYATTIGFPLTVHALTGGPLGLAAGLAVGSCLLGALVPALALARLRPTEAMRGETPASFSAGSRLRRLTALGGPALAYAVRTMLRRPLLSGATVLCMAAAVGLGAAMNVLISSTDHAVQATFARQRWSYSADLATPIPVARAQTLAARAGAPRAEALVKGPAHLRAASGRGADVQLVGLPGGASLQRLQILQGGPPAGGRIVLSEQTAAQLHARVGQRLSLSTPASRAGVLVAGVARTLAVGESYLPRGQASVLLGMPGQATTVLIGGGPDAARRLHEDPRVARVTAKSSAEQGEREMIKEFTGLIDVLLGISLAVGGLFLLSSLALSFLDRQGEFATLRALGHGRRQIAVMVTAEALTQTLLAAALCIPAGLLIAWPLAHQIAKAWFAIGLYPDTPDFLTVILPALALALLAALHSARRAMRIDIASAVRARLIG